MFCVTETRLIDTVLNSLFCPKDYVVFTIQTQKYALVTPVHKNTTTLYIKFQQCLPNVFNCNMLESRSHGMGYYLFIYLFYFFISFYLFYLYWIIASSSWFSFNHKETYGFIKCKSIYTNFAGMFLRLDFKFRISMCVIYFDVKISFDTACLNKLLMMLKFYGRPIWARWPYLGSKLFLCSLWVISYRRYICTTLLLLIMTAKGAY